MVDEMKNTREDTFRPCIVVGYEEEDRTVYFMVGNIG